MSEDKNTEKQDRINLLVNAYKELPVRAKAGLRRVDSYRDVPLLAPEAFWKVKKTVADSYYHDDIISAMLILFRDRGANSSRLENISVPLLGEIFYGKDEKVKLIRLKRILAADNMQSGFTAIRPILRIFRHDSVNWLEVTEFLKALYFKNEDQISYVKKRLADGYFKKYYSEE